jgi:hypothetical protein
MSTALVQLPRPILIAARSIIRRSSRVSANRAWGQAWADNLERYADLANRLRRGRAYLRNGSVLDLTIGPGRVEAYVAASELYRVTVSLVPLAAARWRRVVTRCTGRIGSLVGLLRGELSADVLAVLTDRREGLSPSRDNWRSTARARTPRRRASTWRPCCTAWRCGSTPGRSCSSTSGRWTRPS